VKQLFTEFDNVLYDDSSVREIELLHEAAFLKNTFICLRHIGLEEFSEYIFIVLSSTSLNPKIIPTSTKYNTNKKKILLFLSDETGTTPDYLSNNYYAIFKQYMPSSKFIKRNIFNYPIGFEKDVPSFPIIPLKERKYSVFFSGNLNIWRVGLYLSLISPLFSNPNEFISKLFGFILRHPKAKKLLLFIKSNFSNTFPNSYIRFTHDFKHGLDSRKYGEMLSNSKIVLCPKGFRSTECYRHYEAMRAGCVIISERLPDTHFYKNSPIIQINNWKEGLQKVFALVNDQNRIDEIGTMTNKWWREKCSEEATANYMWLKMQQMV
jgi:hypothetical protein